MNWDTRHFLIIDKGEPYKKGEWLPLNSKETLIGRSWNMNKPGIAFENLFISRKHALVTWNGENFLIEDLQSKHGTQINGIELEPNRPQRINDGDEISLAKGVATMVFKAIRNFDDRTITLNLTNLIPNDLEVFAINLDRREVRIAGRVLNFSGKERDLLRLLYRNRNKAVSYEEIKTALWPERRVGNDTVPDVGNDEITALVYRLRKRLGRQGQKIVTVARYGVLLEMD